METLYQYGKQAILDLIAQYLSLLEATRGLEDVRLEHFEDRTWSLLLLGGKGLLPDEVPLDAPTAYRLHQARGALEHDIQSAVAGPLYVAMRRHAHALAGRATSISNGFTRLAPEQLRSEPELLPVFMHAAGVFSISVLRREVGSVSDTGISEPASRRLADYLAPRLLGDNSPEQVVDRLGSTIEGQARDLLGRYLLEAVVEAAFARQGVPFEHERDYTDLAGVVYDHRADFVVPNAQMPKLFVEVRRSSARHSSLYAKDKMFSAINWKGRHPDLIGVLLLDGEWSRHSRLALARVFDYVLPVSHADRLAAIAQAYLEGDRSKFLRRITFEIEAAGVDAELPPRPHAPSDVSA
jgi:hypothetical protein